MDYETLDRLDDCDLLERFLAAKDERAFEALVRRHGPLVARVCARMLDGADADDAFQATFLVLAQHAAALRKRGSVGPWLYGVAVRVSRKARSGEAARRRREREAGGEVMAQQTDSEAHAREQALWREARPLLDEELEALPEKYRAPLVLCYLEGKSNEQAAAALGWTKGTLSGRLARARDLLRERMGQRGAVLSLAVLVGLLESEAHAATVATALSVGTAKAAALVAAGQVPAAGALSVQANLLYEGVTQMLYWAKVKAAAAVLAATLVAGSGAGLVVWQVQAAEPQAPQAPLPQRAGEAPQPVAGGEAAPAEAPAAPSPVFTLADNGKTVRVKVGEAFAVRLTDDTAGAGWEGGHVNPADEGTLVVSGQRILKDGAYTFTYHTKAEGSVALRMVYVSPGGPGVVDLRKTKLLKEFKLTVEVASPPMYTFTRADHGKTVRVKVGESFEVRLEGDQAKTGWERGYPEPEGYISTRPKLSFQPKAGAADAAIGTYVFTYQALKAVRSVLEMVYVTPGGPVPMARTATALVGEFNLTVDVVEDAPVFEKDGLQVFLKPAKAVLAAKEKLAFTFTYKNSGTKPLLLYDHAFVHAWDMKFRREGEEGWWSKYVPFEWKRVEPTTVQLDPGKTLEVAVDMSPYEYLRGGIPLLRNAAVPDLGPGKCSVIMAFEIEASPAKTEVPFRYWTGKVETKPVAFEIATAP